VIFDAELHGNKGYFKWMVLEWIFMLASTLLVKKAVSVAVQQEQGSFPWGKAAGVAVFLHLLWWCAAPFWCTETTHEYAMIYAMKHPVESSIPFLWLVDGLFVFCQPCFQLQLVRQAQSRELNVGLLLH